eukprot:scaffold6812_cov84-Phaeocystis_antarctica.AAC.2
MQTTRTARCVPANRFPDGVPGTGREPSASPMTNASSAAAPDPASDSDAGPGADADSGPGGDHQLGNKTSFPPCTWPYPHALPSAAARKTQGARAHPPIPSRRHAPRAQWPFSTTYGRMLPTFVTRTFVTRDT